MWFFCLVHALSFIICLYFLYTFINWHLNYFLYIVHVYDINLLIFCQCSNQPLVYPKIDLPGRENSKPLLLSSLPIFPSKYKPSLFLTFPVVFEIEEGAWEWDACEGDRGKKRSRTRRISLKFIWLCFMFFMFFFARTLGWVLVGREQRVLFALGHSRVCHYDL